MTTHTTQCYVSYIPNNQTNKHNPNNQYNDTNAGFIFKFFNKSFRTFHPSPICTLNQSLKTSTWLDEQFGTFHPSLHESVTHPYCLHSHPDSPHSPTYFLHFYPHSPHSSHSFPRFPFPAFTYSLLRSLN